MFTIFRNIPITRGILDKLHGLSDAMIPATSDTIGASK